MGAHLLPEAILLHELKPNMSKVRIKNDIRDVGSTADLVLVFLVHLVNWYMVHWYPLVPDCT